MTTKTKTPAKRLRAENVTSLTPTDVDKLTRHHGGYTFDKLSHITPAAAKKLITKRCAYLSLPALKTLDADIAEELGNFEGTDLSINGAVAKGNNQRWQETSKVEGDLCATGVGGAVDVGVWVVMRGIREGCFVFLW
jgi:hypothetical protein